MTMQKHFYLIRGLAREKAHWGNFIKHLEKVFPDARITCIDLPGAGLYFQKDSPLTVKEMVKQMRRDYMKAKTTSEDSILISVSLGGMICIEWLKTHPEDFSNLTLINTSFGDISPIYHRLKPKAFTHLIKVFALKGRGKEAHILKLVSNNPDVFEKTLDHWAEIDHLRPVSSKNTIRQLMAAAMFRIGKFTPPIPIQIIGSVKDRMVSVKCSRAIAKKWNLPLREHPSGGHDLTLDDPEWVALRIKDFFSQLALVPQESHQSYEQA